jgi:hypothetical protein
MDKAAIKLSLVQKLLDMEDETSLKELENYLNKLTSNQDPYTQEEILAMAKEAEAQYHKGETFSKEEILSKMKSWKK